MKYSKSWNDLNAARRNLISQLRDSASGSPINLTDSGSFMAGVLVGFISAFILMWAMFKGCL